MRRRRTSLIGAAATASALAIAVAAYAVPPEQSTFSVTLKAAPRDAGTQERPKPETVELEITGDTTPAGGSPAASTDIDIQLPKTLKWYGSKWAKSKRCDADAADRDKTDSVCPAGSRVGKGKVVATAQPDPAQPKIVEEIELVAYVLKSRKGGLGLGLEASAATQPVPISVMLRGKISRKNTRISFHIPENVQEPVTNVPTGIETLRFRLDGKTRSKGDEYGAISSVGCKDRKWKINVSNRYQGGLRKADSDTIRCSR